MRIIKLEIQIISRNYTIRVLRQAVSLDKSSITRVSDFIDYVKKIRNLKGDYEIDIDGFKIAPNDTVRILKQNRIYTLRIVREPSISVQISQQSINEQVEQSLEEQRAASKALPLNKTNRPQPKISKTQQKVQKQKEKQRIIRKKKLQSKSEKDSSSESEEDQIQIKQSKNKKNLEKKQVQKKDTKEPQSKIKNKPIQKTQKESAEKIVVKNVMKKQNSSDSESSSSQLPIIFPRQNKEPVYDHKKNEAIVEQQTKNQIITENKVKLGAGIKKSIIDSSSQSSPSKQKTPQVRPKISQPVHKQQKMVSKTKAQNLKLPPALRNKMQTNKFQKHQQNQWIMVDKQKYVKWQQLGYKTLSQPPNKIRFKIVQLDEEKFIPVKSNWITGEVTSTTESGVVNLINVQQEGKDFMKNYQIPQMNMDELQLFRPLASKEQVQSLCDSQNQENQKQPKRSEPIKTQINILQQPPNSVEKYVCGQVNYYFSDKNYLTDCYMQLHANSHPQKFMKLSFMLNFPKIKKVLRDEDKLLEYLKEDEKYESRNFQIDFDNKMIRKKNIIQQPKNINQQQIQSIDQEGKQLSVKAQEKI